MIRRNVVAIVSVCAALAVGVALGGGPLSDIGHADDPAVPTTHADRALAASAALGQKWTAQAAPLLYGGRLAGHQVAIVAMPGASHQLVQQLADGVAVAKGTVVTTLTVQPMTLDATQRTMIDTLGAKFAKQSKGTVDPNGSTYSRIGQIMGLSVAGAPDESAAGIGETSQETLEAGKLATVQGGKSRADDVLVVLGSHADPTALHDLVSGLGSRTHGVVVAGDTASGAKGDLKALREAGHSDNVVTVDGDDTAYGRASVILGLVRQISPSGGDFGASGIDGLVPLG
jgi:hypothetical protein